MKTWMRVALAIGIVVLDFTIFMLPLGSILLAYVLIARPVWFEDFMFEIYNS